MYYHEQSFATRTLRACEGILERAARRQAEADKQHAEFVRACRDTKPSVKQEEKKQQANRVSLTPEERLKRYKRVVELMEADDMLTVTEASNAVGIHVSSVQKWMRTNGITKFEGRFLALKELRAQRWCASDDAAQIRKAHKEGVIYSQALREFGEWRVQKYEKYTGKKFARKLTQLNRRIGKEIK